MSRRINDAGLEIVMHFEGCFLEAYKCPAGVWTIGWGHTGLVHNDGTVKAGRKITRTEAQDLLRHDMDVFAAEVEQRVKAPVNDNQFSALVSFAFNVGAGALGHSTLLRKLNAGDYFGAALQFEVWNRSKGKVLAGLTRRRRSERNLFCGFPHPLVTQL